MTCNDEEKTQLRAEEESLHSAAESLATALDAAMADIAVATGTTPAIEYLSDTTAALTTTAVPTTAITTTSAPTAISTAVTASEASSTTTTTTTTTTFGFETGSLNS